VPYAGGAFTPGASCPPGQRDNGAVHDDEAARARQRRLVRRGYDAMSEAYRDDGGQSAGTDDTSRYAGWAAELAERLRPGARVLDLGCGAGIPATRELADRGLQVIGVDFSAAQLHRARGWSLRPAWCRPTWRRSSSARPAWTPWCPSTP